MTIRKAVWANQFYPSDPSDACAMWEDFFKKCKYPRINASLKALQVPHAGWQYSGQAAAEAFKQLKDSGVQTIVLIGPQHRLAKKYMQVFPEGIWESPLGNLEIDANIAASFIDYNEAFQPDIKAHAAEHSLEVQIPPLIMVLPNVKIVPILTAAYQREHPRILADALAKIVGLQSDIAVLISTDLYHGESYKVCKTTDARTLELVENLDAEGLEQALAQGTAAACGEEAMLALLYASERLSVKKAHLLAAYNSNDITGSKGGYVVGYSAFAFTGV